MDEKPYRAPEGDLTPPSMRPGLEKRFPLLTFVGLICGMVFGWLTAAVVNPPGWLASVSIPVITYGLIGLGIGTAIDAVRTRRK